MSVIVPARDAAATIGRTLAALADQDIAEPYEVIVVDDGSTDATPAVVGRAGVRLLRQRRRGPAAARNLGAAQAAAEILAFTDADCFPTAGWLSNGVRAMADHDMVQGGVRPESGVRMRPYDRSLWVGREVGLYEAANLLVSRSLFDRVGGFEEWLLPEIGKAIAEDAWFGWRARRAGARIAFCGEALVEHAVFRRTPVEALAERRRLRYFPAIARKMPELRRQMFFARCFLTRRTAAFDLALVAVAVAATRRSGRPAAMVLPYLALLMSESLAWGRYAPVAAALGPVADAVGVVALVRGSIRWRTLVL